MWNTRKARSSKIGLIVPDETAPLGAVFLLLHGVADAAGPRQIWGSFGEERMAEHDLQDYLFDLNGYLILENVIAPDHLAALNAAFDGFRRIWGSRTGGVMFSGWTTMPARGWSCRTSSMPGNRLKT